MNFGAVLGASLRSGYALPPRRTENGLPHQPAEAPLIKAETVSRRSQPPLSLVGFPLPHPAREARPPMVHSAMIATLVTSCSW